MNHSYLKLAAGIFFFLGGLIMLFVARDLHTTSREQRQATECILYDLHEHRINNYRADKMQSEALTGEEFTLDPPPPVPDEWKDACDPFFEVNQD